MTSHSYRPDIDGLRAVAVLTVVFHHLVPEVIPGGYIGVDVFFVISGYLITNIIRSELEAGTFKFADFYERRARRILPALFCVLSFTFVVGHFVLLPSDLVSTLRTGVGTTLFSANLVLWRDLARGYFAATDASLNPLLHTWSLGVEEQFYLAFPLLLLLTSRVSILIGLTITSLLTSVLLLESRSVAVFFLSPFRAWELMAGALLTYTPRISRGDVREAVAVVGLAAIVIPCFTYSPSTKFPGLTALAPVLGAAIIMHARDTAVSRVLSIRPLVFIGLISYSLYLWHWPLLVYSRYLGRNSVPLLFGASLLLAYLSFRFIERPFRRKHGSRVFLASGAAIATFCLLATPGILFRGYEGRVSPDVVALDQARTPSIPFVQCDGLSVNSGCRIGSPGDPTVVVWGDSHMIAWAPGLDAALKALAKPAVMSVVSSCPPIIGATSENTNCAGRNAEVAKYVLRPSVDTIVLAAFWSHYEGQESLLRDTIKLLNSNGKRVLLLGPVPIHAMQVPLALALEQQQGRTVLPPTTEAAQRQKHEQFYLSIRGAELADPVTWLCTPGCLTYANGQVLYRDAHHLSVAGAMLLVPRLKAALMM